MLCDTKEFEVHLQRNINGFFGFTYASNTNCINKYPLIERALKESGLQKDDKILKIKTPTFPEWKDLKHKYDLTKYLQADNKIVLWVQREKENEIQFGDFSDDEILPEKKRKKEESLGYEICIDEIWRNCTLAGKSEDGRYIFKDQEDESKIYALSQEEVKTLVLAKKYI
jgi:hypothetical protein